MQVNSYLTFNGQCEAAFKFYAQCLGGKIEAMMTHGDSPLANQVSSEWRKKILHARLMVGDKALMGSDAPPERYENHKASPWRSASTIRQRQSVSFTHCPKTGQ
jgi:PhnB protein